MNIKLFKSKMVLAGDTNASLALALGITPQTNSAKLNGTHGSEYTRREIELIRNRWNLTAEEIDLIFFANEVS